ncbi:hypothetical protein [Riemerella anatipestifer]|uniref:hypothetical protein n=1 Tax=Riemerella anatipestifer TaxID=34085 RepID=UPI0028639AD5|nr:hypothetical protein [Riemerella anatipestifer]MDR7712475.1 hypothetical protein [Riemerella anatipestifer]MDR7724823.1 hypothetical protein [Riemerella anatipestifer]MDR7735301.1 hypothetical protein [Riemerella anatipestifer]MDR7772742.1 hypothetical protein [Riemerella anatipestifer]
MEKSRNFYGQINFDKLLEGVKSGKVKTQIVEKKDGSKFRAVNINVWVNDEPKYNQDASISLQNKEEFQNEKNIYIGNLKYMTSKVTEATAEDFSDVEPYEML